jgi:hypothetical protein
MLQLNRDMLKAILIGSLSATLGFGLLWIVVWLAQGGLSISLSIFKSIEDWNLFIKVPLQFLSGSAVIISFLLAFLAPLLVPAVANVQMFTAFSAQRGNRAAVRAVCVASATVVSAWLIWSQFIWIAVYKEGKPVEIWRAIYVIAVALHGAFYVLFGNSRLAPVGSCPDSTTGAPTESTQHGELPGQSSAYESRWKPVKCKGCGAFYPESDAVCPSCGKG